MPDLNWREREALQAFELKAVLYFYDLPTFVGRKTMKGLVARGLVEVVDRKVGEYAGKYAWRRK